MKDTTWMTVGCVALVGLIVAAAYYDAKQWDEFKAAHECKVVAKVSGDWINTTSVDAKGNVTTGLTRTADKTGWLCDDGVTYYR